MSIHQNSTLNNMKRLVEKYYKVFWMYKGLSCVKGGFVLLSKKNYTRKFTLLLKNLYKKACNFWPKKIVWEILQFFYKKILWKVLWYV